MTRYKCIIVFLNFCIFTGIVKSQEIISTETTQRVYIIDTSSYWTNVSPLNFIDTLKKYPIKFMVRCLPPDSWYDTTAIIELEKQKIDTSRAGIAISGYDSYLYLETDLKSTVSEQAQCLIDGIRGKLYPPTYWFLYRRKK